MQVWSQDAAHGALPLIKALTDPNLEGKGFGYFGPFYKGLILLHLGNMRACNASISCAKLTCPVCLTL
jgi:hypothetical protein